MLLAIRRIASKISRKDCQAQSTVPAVVVVVEGEENAVRMSHPDRVQATPDSVT